MRKVVYTLIVMSTVYVLVLTTPEWYKSRGYVGQHFVGCDFRIYYEAASGNFDWARGKDWPNPANIAGWLYPRWTATLWVPFTWIGFKSAYILWSAILTGAYILLARRLMNEKWAWIVVLAGIKPFMFCIQSGNIVPLVALAMASPFGCILGGCFKLWPLGGIGLHLLVGVARGSGRSGRVFHFQSH